MSLRFGGVMIAMALAGQVCGQIFAPGDPIIGGQRDATNFNVGTAGLLGNANNWPFGETPANAIDGVGSKYLNFAKTNTGFIVTPSAGSTVAKDITFWTANDAVGRDPASYELYGTNNIVSGSGPFPLANFTLIASGDLELPDTRNLGGPAPLETANSQSVPFLNSDAYTSYMVIFPDVKDNALVNSMQIAEVQLNVGPPVLTLEVNTLTGNVSIANDSGSPIAVRAYQIESPGGSLNPSGWTSLQDNPSFPAATSPGAGDGWEEGGGSSTTRMTEAFLLGDSTFNTGPPVSLGAIYDTSVNAMDLRFKFSPADGTPLLALVKYVSAGLTCDFNGDSNCNIDDIDLLFAQLGSSNPQFDLDGDGTVGPGDITSWLTQASNADPLGRTFKTGDTNLDGQVGGGDFTAVASNFGTAPATWGQGNFDGSVDGVGGSDFTALASNFGFTSVVGAVPEPAGHCLILLGSLLICLRKRRRL